MNELHSDALLGGMWRWDDDDDDAYVVDRDEQIRDLRALVLDSAEN